MISVLPCGCDEIAPCAQHARKDEPKTNDPVPAPPINPFPAYGSAQGYACD